MCINLSIHVSKLESRVETLAEEVALLRGPVGAPSSAGPVRVPVRPPPPPSQPAAGRAADVADGADAARPEATPTPEERVRRPPASRLGAAADVPAARALGRYAGRARGRTAPAGRR